MKRYSAEEAQTVLTERATLVGIERVPSGEASGRILAQDIEAGLGLPSFDQSAVDGYAVLPSKETLFHLKGAVYAGDRPLALEAGEAVFVATGAPVPPGCGVVMKEKVEVEGETVRLIAPEAGTNVRIRGEELSVGARALRAGVRLGPGEIALLMALDVREVTVRRRVRALVLSTGSELREGEGPLEEGLVRNTNGPWLRLRLEGLGVAVENLLVPDDEEVFHTSVREKMDHADLVLSTGGISVGPKDFVARVVETLGLEAIIRGVAFRPAYPLSSFARDGGPIWVALPGNPLATALGFDRLVRPLLAAMEGRVSEALWSEASLATSMRSNHSDYDRYWPCDVTFGERGLIATPAIYAASNSVSALRSLRGWILRGRDAKEAAAGETVRVWLGAGPGN